MASTVFYTTFLLAVPFIQDVRKKKGKKKGTRHSKSKKKKKIVKEVVLEEEVFSGQLEVGKASVFVHMEYTIIPDILVYDWDMVCFGNVAKIYSREGNLAVKTLVTDSIAWVGFTVEHCLEMSDELLEILHGCTPSFNLWHDKKKLCKSSQTDKPKVFQMAQKDIDRVREGKVETMFAPLEECVITDRIVERNVNLSQQSELVENTWRSRPYPGHKETLKQLVKTHSDSIQMLPNEEQGKKKKGTSKKEKKMKDKKGKKSPTAGSEEMTMLGELFFANIRELKVEKELHLSSVKYMGVLLTVDDLYDEKQLFYFNPAIVQIREANNLPVELFKQHGFEWVYMKYTLPNEKEYVTEKKRVEETMSFNDTRVMFTHNINATKVMEFLMSKFLCLQLWGVRDETASAGHVVPSELFRLTLGNRCMLSRLLPDPYNHPQSQTEGEAVRYVEDSIREAVCLAEAEMDVSAISFQMLVESTCSLRRPRPLFEHGPSSGCWALFNLPDVHGPGREDFINTSPFTDFQLQPATVEVAFKTLAPLTSIMLDAYQSKEHYNRLVLVIHSPLESKLCISIIEEIYKINLPYVRLLKPPNDLYYARKEFLKPHCGEYSESVTELLKGKQHFYQSRIGGFRSHVYHRSAVSGFLVDDFHRVLVVLEGRAQSSLLKIFSFLEDLEATSKFTIHYNSEMAFQTRLYGEFLDTGGIIVINMDEPLEVKQMRKEFLLARRSTAAPSRAVHTVNKLINLFRVKDIMTASRQDLFPSPLHLVSFALEFGVPFRAIGDYTETPTPLATSETTISVDTDLVVDESKAEEKSTIFVMDGDVESIGFDPPSSYTDKYLSTIFKPTEKFTLAHSCTSTLSTHSSQTPFTPEPSTTLLQSHGYLPPLLEGSPLTEPTSSMTPLAKMSESKSVALTTAKSSKRLLHPKRHRKEDPAVPSSVDISHQPSQIDRNGQNAGEPPSAKRPGSICSSTKLAPLEDAVDYGDEQSQMYQPDLSTLLLPTQKSRVVDFTTEPGPVDVEPPCPIQVQYFKDFLSGVDLRALKQASLQFSDTTHSDLSSIRATQVSTSVMAVSSTTRASRDTMRSSSAKSLPEGRVIPLRRTKKKEKEKDELGNTFRRSKPSTPPEPPCPIQDYFVDFYEASSHKKITSQTMQ